MTGHHQTNNKMRFVPSHGSVEVLLPWRGGDEPNPDVESGTERECITSRRDVSTSSEARPLFVSRGCGRTSVLREVTGYHTFFGLKKAEKKHVPEYFNITELVVKPAFLIARFLQRGPVLYRSVNRVAVRGNGKILDKLPRRARDFGSRICWCTTRDR